jgi:hypothetical protein
MSGGIRVTGRNLFRILNRNGHKFLIVPFPPYKTVSRRLAKSDTEPERRRGCYECLEKILNRFDEVALSQDDIAVLRELRLNKGPTGCLRHVFSSLVEFFLVLSTFL